MYRRCLFYQALQLFDNLEFHRPAKQVPRSVPAKASIYSDTTDPEPLYIRVELG